MTMVAMTVATTNLAVIEDPRPAYQKYQDAYEGRKIDYVLKHQILDDLRALESLDQREGKLSEDREHCKYLLRGYLHQVLDNYYLRF